MWIVDEKVGEGVDKFIAHCSKAFTTFNELQEMESVSYRDRHRSNHTQIIPSVILLQYINSPVTLHWPSQWIISNHM